MSQQINLLNPALRTRHDWLSFTIVAPVALAVAALVAVAAVWVRIERDELANREAVMAAELKTSQERLQSLAKALEERRGDPALEGESRRLAAAVQRHRDILQMLAEGGLDKGAGFADAMAGLSRQAMEGLWLTAFSMAGGDLEIRGRMLDPGLLPNYIRRLNAESAFRGRRFDMLDMKGVLPPRATAPTGPSPTMAQPRLPKHTEFVLRSSNAPQAVPVGGAR